MTGEDPLLYVSACRVRHVEVVNAAHSCNMVETAASVWHMFCPWMRKKKCLPLISQANYLTSTRLEYNMVMIGKRNRRRNKKETISNPLEKRAGRMKTKPLTYNVTNKGRIWRLYCCCISNVLGCALRFKRGEWQGQTTWSHILCYICKEMRSRLPIHVEFHALCRCYGPLMSLKAVY